MEALMQGWLSIWLYVMAAIGIVLGVLIWKNRKTWSALNILCTLAIIVLILHVIEEWVLPGGLHYSYNINHGSEYLSRYPMNRLTDMITNFGGALIWFILVQTDKYERKMSFAVMLFGYAEVAIHVLGASSSRTLLLESGVYSPFYGPGMLTALVCWLPLAVVYTAYFVKTRVKLRDVIGGVILVVLSILLITMPESLLKNENTPYVFDNAGWYEQYIDESGAIINRSQE